MFCCVHQYILHVVKVDLDIFNSGDNPPHDVWMETWNGQLQASEYIVDYISKQLPNTTIYPVFGNHGKVCCM